MNLSLIPTIATAALAPADTARGGDASGRVAEFVRFRLAGGVADAAVLAASRAMQPALASAPGYVSRRLSRNADGTWTDDVVWADLARTEAAQHAIFADPAAKSFVDAIDGASVDMRHEPILLHTG